MILKTREFLPLLAKMVREVLNHSHHSANKTLGLQNMHFECSTDFLCEAEGALKFALALRKSPWSCQILGLPGVELTLSICSNWHAKSQDNDADACKACISKHGGSERTMVRYLSVP